MADVILAEQVVDSVDDSGAPEDDVVDDDLVLQRYNSQLPPNYRANLDSERKLLIRALRVLVKSILRSNEAADDSKESDSGMQNDYNGSVEEDAVVSEGYQHSFERDLAALEKAVNRYLDLKHALDAEDYPVLFNIALRGALSPTVDMGLRSKLARCAGRLLSKRQCEIPHGIDWRPIMDQLIKVHLDCVDGGPFIGRDVRDSHCRNFVSLLTKSRNYLSPRESAEMIWSEFAPKLRTTDVDSQFRELLLLSHVIPTRGESWSGWITEGMRLWQTIESSSDWDSIWMGLFARLARHQPCAHDWTPYLSWIYNRITSAFRLPLGGLAPQSAIDRRCPHTCYFLMDGKTIPMAASLSVSLLSPKCPATLEYLERLFALIANYFHPSNSGRWSPAIGSFLVHVSANLALRVSDERNASKAGIMTRVLGTKTQRGVAPDDHRLSEGFIQRLVELMLPLVQHGLHSKVSMMSVQAASAARDLALILPFQVVEPFLQQAADGLGSISTPHRTTAALKLLAALTPVFLDPDICPNGGDYLPQTLDLTLPGIDPNDPGKTEATLRFIAGASARLQSTVAGDRMTGLGDFLENYISQVLDRVFGLLESLEAPPKKNRNGSYASGGTQLSYFIFSVAMENLFAALPGRIAVSAAHRIARQLTGPPCTNGMKYYGALVRTAAAAAAVAQSGSSVGIFVPSLTDSLLVPSDASSDDFSEMLASISEEDQVWRIRMLAQACRCTGTGLDPYLPKITTIIRVALDKPSRPVYKAGGRLLRGVLEGLTSIQMVFGPGQGSDADSTADGGIYNFEWRVPSTDEWSLAERILESFVVRAEELCTATGDGGSVSITSDRDVLFRALRLLHAIQRGGRWLLAGALPDVYKSLDKFVDEDVEMTKKEALLALKRPIAAGLGGERTGEGGEQYATKIWARVHNLVSKIISTVLSTRPDDGALLYRCLEPIELAHEPFRRGDRSRQTMHASRAYKSAYKPVILAKRPFGAEGGVGRAMPRFIVKLRIEAHHEMRLSIGARAGMTSMGVCETLVRQLADLALNDFPRVRGEARGVLTRALRIVRPWVRRQEVVRIIEVLRGSVEMSMSRRESQKSRHAGGKQSCTSDSTQYDDTSERIVDGGKTLSSKEDDILYEKMIGASAILRSTAVAPFVMRDWGLFTDMVKALIAAMPKAERADGANATAGLFAKLSSLVRPLGIEPIRLVREDLRSVAASAPNEAEAEERSRRTTSYESLNEYLLGVLETSPDPVGTVGTNGKSAFGSRTGKSMEAHWRLQVLVATILYITLREDRGPPAAVTRFFVEGITSDVVSLRQICARAMMLVLAIHGRKPGTVLLEGEGFDDSATAWESVGNDAVAAVASLVNSKEYARELVHTLALDHDDGTEGSGRSRFGMVGGAGGAIAFMNFSRSMDGDASWMLAGGRPWPTSWCPRSRDSLNIVRIRFYESLVRVFGMNFYDAVLPTLKELIEKVKDKKEKIIDGVKDEDVKVLAGEVLAGICRGLSLASCKKAQVQVEQNLEELAAALLAELSGPVGNMNGGTLVRLICTSDPFTVGSRVRDGILTWLLEPRPLLVPMGDGPVAHLQARRLRYLHSCVADIDTATNDTIVRYARNSITALASEVGFDHEMKTVREEVARCLAVIAVDVPEPCKELFDQEITSLFTRLEKSYDTDKNSSVESESDGIDPAAEAAKKSRSRQGETLSRFVSIAQWNGKARGFERYAAKALPALFTSLDESDPERISHARMALSFIAQGTFATATIDEIIGVVERIGGDNRWKVRGSVLPFLQVFSFSSLFTASTESLQRIRKIVIKLLSDTQLEIRQAAGGALVTMIRDTTKEAVEQVRISCMKVLKDTTPQRRGAKRSSMDADTIRRRHGAVLGLSSMVVSSPYAIPEWMPSVLVGLSRCVNDGPPISTGVRKLFADFMRTHRDEWQTHKLAFTPDELDIVSELLISPSYYA